MPIRIGAPVWLLLGAFIGASVPHASFAGNQIYEPLAASVQSGLRAAIAERPAPNHGFTDSVQAANWLTEMSHRLERRIPGFETRLDFLRSAHYEATRAGLDPQLLLAIIQVESNFRKYTIFQCGRQRIHAGDAFLDRCNRPPERQSVQPAHQLALWLYSGPRFQDRGLSCALS